MVNNIARKLKIKQLVEQLKLELLVKELGSEKVHCFQNGVLFSKDKIFVEFDDERLTNVILSNSILLEYRNKNIIMDIPQIWKDFLKTLLKWNTVKAEDILAVILAHIMGLVSLQAIYYLGGPPRSGKALLMRLITYLFGSDVASFTVSAMNANPRFFLSFLEGKYVLCFPDERIENFSQSGRDMLKRLTGEDILTVETKGLTITNSITGYYPVIITSQSDLTWVQDPGITRRLVYLHFHKSIKEDEVNSNIFSELSSDMGWLIDMAIDMTQERAKKILLEMSSEYKRKFPPTQILSILHSLHLEYGVNYFETTENLYLRYSYICAEIGLKAMSKASFSTNLIQTIGLEKGIYLESGRSRRARGIFGIRLKDLTIVENESDSFKDMVSLTINETVNDNETITTKETVNKKETVNDKCFTEELSTVNKDKLNQIYYEQLTIAKQIKKNLLCIASQYEMSVQFPDAVYAEASQSLFLDLFRTLEIFNDKGEASRKFNEILIPLQQRFKDSDRSHFPWLKSKRFKSNIFPSYLCINDKFYPRCFEKQELILNKNGKKIGSNSPNVSLPADIRVKWYVDCCHDLFHLKPITVDLAAAHLHVFASSMNLQELTERVLGGNMWEYVIKNLPPLFNKKSFLKKILYSG